MRNKHVLIFSASKLRNMEGNLSYSNTPFRFGFHYLKTQWSSFQNSAKKVHKTVDYNDFSFFDFFCDMFCELCLLKVLSDYRFSRLFFHICLCWNYIHISNKESSLNVGGVSNPQLIQLTFILSQPLNTNKIRNIGL